jgi:hypothetical protein
MEKKNDPKKKFAELKKQLEARGRNLIDMSPKIKSMGFVCGIGPHYKSPEKKHLSQRL